MNNFLNSVLIDRHKISLNNYDYKTNYAIGHHYVEYSKDNSANNYIKKMIIPIAIPGMTEISDARSYSDIGELEWTKKAKLGEEQHHVKSYEVYAEMIKSDIDDYIRENHLHGDYKRVYWVTGYKEGGAIANILAAKLRDMGQAVYAYTFGAPMTIYNNPDELGFTKTGYSARYDCIFNVVNEDDAYAYMMPQEIGFSRYGMTCFGSGRGLVNQYKGSEEIRNEVIESFNKIYKGKESKTRTYTYDSKDYKETFTIDNRKVTYNTIQDYLSAFLEAIKADRGSLTFDNIKSFCQRGAKANNIKVFKNKLKANYEKLKRAGEEDVYYTLAENMQNADITNVVNLRDKKEKRVVKPATISYIPMNKALKEMGEWYCNNIYTYNPYSNRDFTRNGQDKTFSSRFQYDYDKASANAKREREIRVNAYNEIHPANKYEISKFVNESSYNLDLETFIGKHGDHALYACELLDDPIYSEYKDVGDDCSSFTMAVMYYATKGMMDEYEVLNIYDLGGGA